MVTTICCFVLLSTVGAHSAAPLSRAAALPTTYLLVSGRSDDLNAAINRATARLNFVTRPIARSRLRRTNAAYKDIVIDERADTIEITYEGRPPVRAPANGGPAQWRREDGEKFQIWMKREG